MTADASAMDGPPSAGAASRESICVVSGITKDFGGREASAPALQDIGFALPKGAFWSIVGPSGCGKSTLLSIIAGLLAPTAGQVHLGGRPLSRPNAERATLIFQDPVLLPWRTALDNVAFPLELRGVSAAERRARALELLRLVRLDDVAASYPHELSGGMRQRVAIARGLVLDPEILLMDEPFGALDEQSRMRMGEELLRIWDRTRKTILFVTHSLSEAIYLSDEVLVLQGRPGRIVERLAIPLARPRGLEVIGTPEFGRLRNHLWSLLADPGR